MKLLKIFLLVFSLTFGLTLVGCGDTAEKVDDAYEENIVEDDEFKDAGVDGRVDEQTLDELEASENPDDLDVRPNMANLVVKTNFPAGTKYDIYINEEKVLADENGTKKANESVEIKHIFKDGENNIVGEIHAPGRPNTNDATRFSEQFTWPEDASSAAKLVIDVGPGNGDDLEVDIQISDAKIKMERSVTPHERN